MISLGWLISGPFLYMAAAVFICVTAYKIAGFSRMPRPLRWDIYPLPHRGQVGSKYQKLDFNRQKAPYFLGRELLAMAEEIFLIKRLFVNNLRLWFGSYALHTGLYLGVLWIVLLTVGAISQINDGILNSATIVAGAGVIILGLTGSICLLAFRYIDRDLRAMSDFVSFLNLGLMIAVFGSALAAWLVADNSFSHLRSQIANLITFKPTASDNILITAEFLFFGLFLMYLPFSRMLHFAAKYFFYHKIMWDDEAMKSGGELELERLKELAYRPRWAAPHIKANRSWLEQVTDERTEEGKKGE